MSTGANIRRLSGIIASVALFGCGGSTSPVQRYTGTFALQSPLPYGGSNGSVVSETLYIGSQGSWQRSYVLPAGRSAASLVGRIHVDGDSIRFDGGFDDRPRLVAGALAGTTLEVRARDDAAETDMLFIYSRVR